MKCLIFMYSIPKILEQTMIAPNWFRVKRSISLLLIQWISTYKYIMSVLYFYNDCYLSTNQKISIRFLYTQLNPWSLMLRIP